MDQRLRNKLRNVVTQCRKLLEEAVSHELQGRFGIHTSGKKDEVVIEDEARMANLSDEERTYRRDLIDHYEHIRAFGSKPKDALAQLIREIAFTHLNRLCAYKMMEARDVYVGGQRFREAVSRGVHSNGVKFYLADHPDDERLFNTGQQDIAYRHFLDWLGGLLSAEIGILFNPNDPANRLYPPQRVLDDVLALINDEELAGIWSQDETIGWVYQYFTPKDLRDKARKESQTPRNSYELSFRNQFYTPHYVVQFLVDNTLGRMWYEMRQGETMLKEHCQYLVWRPNETFSRKKKDPREIAILDPACGSGHFLLYCFDILEIMYEEAYHDPDLEPSLKRDYPTPADLKKAIPGLILRHNLHGIDIDLRATQIAALALWLRAQRTYQVMGLKGSVRPQITRSNIVCAEPMPGEQEVLQEFVAALRPKVLGQLMQAVFNKMTLASEAGSLLKIEDELTDAIEAARKQWLARPKEEQLTLFPEERRVNAQQMSLFDISGVTEEQFWDEAEARVTDTLRDYAKQAAIGTGLTRQLFVEDTVHGFAFVDICRKRFDVVLMNPPFGEASKPSKSYIEKSYPRTKNDVYAAFVERGLQLLQPHGMLGAITSRTGFFLSSFQKWREEILLKEARPTVFADLGYGVLDTAMVETAAYCLEAVR